MIFNPGLNLLESSNLNTLYKFRPLYKWFVKNGELCNCIPVVMLCFNL